MISLPKKWIKSHNLQQGDEVLVFADENMVVIIPKEYKKIVKVTIKGIPKRTEDFLRRYIYAIYMLGFDEIVLEGIEDKSLTSKLTEIIHDLIGMEVIDMSPNKVVFRILVTPELDVITLLKRIVQMVNSMFLYTKAFLEGDDTALSEIQKLEVNIDRFYWLAVRLENRIIRESFGKWSELRFILGSRMVAKILEDISDHLLQFATLLSEARSEVKSAEFIDDVRDLFNKSFESYLNIDLSMADDVIVMVEKQQKDLMENIRKSRDAKTALALQNVLEILWSVRSLGEIAINRAVREMVEKI